MRCIKDWILYVAVSCFNLNIIFVDAVKTVKSFQQASQDLEQKDIQASTDRHRIPDLNHPPPFESEDEHSSPPLHSDQPLAICDDTRSTDIFSSSKNQSTSKGREKEQEKKVHRRYWQKWYSKLTPEQKKARSIRDNRTYRARIGRLSAEDQKRTKEKVNNRVKKSRASKDPEEVKELNRRHAKAYRERQKLLRKGKALSQTP
ncbi:uncharacterized protein FA14DRAFT_178337 [Meira miltonrushii]|uniref:Uncharacterized protein n=1 Tax=Meira miltonrushii TaxID=1280837 RepID=A0A316VCB8_9BASI|nr:uncharacterized protein FA14DRAFT_178337 [Meira miltonrushii]PWN34944.1 hypothetical protein FA14DRAFT_178337 [Meira miltonrushii]